MTTEADTTTGRPGLRKRQRALLLIAWILVGVLVIGLLDRLVFGHRHLQGAHIERVLAGELRALPRAIGFLGGYMLVAGAAMTCGLVVGPMRHRGAAAVVLLACLAGAGWLTTEFLPYGLLGGGPSSDWVEYRSPDGAFVVQMPGEPQVRDLREDSAFGPVEMSIISFQRGELMASVVVEQYEDPAFLERDIRAILEHERNRMALRFDAHIAEESDVEHDGHDARSIRAVIREKGMTFIVDGLIVVGPDRVYRLTVTAGDDETRGAHAAEFFGSFRIEE
jgi:hypothetical protein